MKPSIPKGTRDFLPGEVYKRQYIFDTIRSVFEIYGYQPIETPVMENLSTLTGKYGDEGDQLLFKILNNGDYLSKADQSALQDKDSKKLVSSIAKKGLRYDLTVPFARFVTMHQNDISFPFKRYQIQQVWRGDRPQKGRYQEFYQCDVDVVGSDSLMYEAELVKIYDEVFYKLGIKSTIKVNNRKVLFGIAEYCGCTELFIPFTIILDKLDKIGKENVIDQLNEKGIDKQSVLNIFDCLDTTYNDCTDEHCEECGDQDIEYVKREFGDFADEICLINCLLVKFRDKGCDTGIQGLNEIKEVITYLKDTSFEGKLKFDISLARGLNYYTGCIFEVVSNNDIGVGSIGGGGRYDDLTSSFGLKGVSGVGVSFGAARIYDVMEELDLFPVSVQQKLKFLLIAFDEDSHTYAFTQLSKLRQAGISADLYPSPTKLKKQMKYANAIGVPNVILIGSDEVASGVLTIREMKSGDQSNKSIDELILDIQTTISVNDLYNSQKIDESDIY